ncbi:MAG: hypothetical protein NTW86_22335 [Candidatus Sumerlaeota bacterium]|nr:hypothetical protein [Candidatus Sumerlaeota bacterium]
MTGKTVNLQKLVDWAMAPVWAAAYFPLEALLRKMPEPEGYRLSRVVGSLFHPPPMRRRSLAMMKAILDRPDWTEAQWRELRKDYFGWTGRMALECLYWLRLPADELRRRVTVRGQEHLDEARRTGRGALLLGSHLGNFISFLARGASLAPEVAALQNRLPAAVLERRFQAFHERFSVQRWKVGETKALRIARILRRNGVILTFVDVSVAPKNNVWVRFGRGETLVSLGPAILALRNRVEALCVTFTPLGNGRHQMDIHPPLPRPCSGDLAEDARRLTQQAVDLVANEVNRRPEQWWPWDAARYRPGPDHV